jgi:hypothetical protein
MSDLLPIVLHIGQLLLFAFAACFRSAVVDVLSVVAGLRFKRITSVLIAAPAIAAISVTVGVLRLHGETSLSPGMVAGVVVLQALAAAALGALAFLFKRLVILDDQQRSGGSPRTGEST